MTINTTLMTESGSAPHATRTAQLPISAAGVTDMSALARQQLVNAVPAPALIPAYASNVTPPKQQPANKATLSAPSSALAAQLIAQSPGILPDELEIFEARTPALTTGEYVEQGDEFLAAMRTARGDLNAPLPTPPKAPVVAQPVVPQQTMNAAQATTAKASTDGGLQVSLAAHLPAVLAPTIRTVTLTQARGVGAYQLAELRNAATRKPATVKEAL